MSVDIVVIVAEGVAVIIQRFPGRAPWEDRYGYCRVVRAGPWVGTAGTTATGPDGVLHPGDPYRQTLAAFTIALDALRLAGATPDQVVRTRMYVIDITQQELIGAAHHELFFQIKPVATMVQVGALAEVEHLVEVEVEAYLQDSEP
jgi:enamine deaminase RidA (YjgF/YER057c/UK114 family)